MPLRLRASTRSWSSASGEAFRIWLASEGAKIPFFTRTSNSAATLALATGAGLEDEFLFAELSPPSLAFVVSSVPGADVEGVFAFAVSSSVRASRGVTERHANSRIPIQRVSFIEAWVSSAGTLGRDRSRAARRQEAITTVERTFRSLSNLCPSARRKMSQNVFDVNKN